MVGASSSIGWVAVKQQQSKHHSHYTISLHLECHQTFTVLCQSGNAVGGRSTLGFYRRLVVGKSDDVLRETVGVDEKYCLISSGELSGRGL